MFLNKRVPLWALLLFICSQSQVHSAVDCSRLSSALNKLEIRKATKHTVDNFYSQIQVAKELTDAEKLVIKPIVDDVIRAYELGDERLQLLEELVPLRITLDRLPEDELKFNQMEKKLRELEAEINKLNDKFINELSTLYKEKGIPARVTRTSVETHLELDFYGTTAKGTTSEFFEKTQIKFGLNKVTISLKENATFGSRGFYFDQGKRIEIGPHQAISLLHDHINTISKHESRHAMFSSKRQKGIESIYHTTFTSSPRAPLSEMRGYDKFMSAEEVYNYATDMNTFSQILRKPLPQKQIDNIIEEILSGHDRFNDIMNTNKNMAGDMLSSLNKDIETNQFNNMIMDNRRSGALLTLKDHLGREAKVTFASQKNKDLFVKLNLLQEEQKKVFEAFFTTKMKEHGIDYENYLMNLPYGGVKASEKKIYQELMEQYNATFAKKIQNENKALYLEVMTMAQKSLMSLQKVSHAQLKEGKELIDLVKTYKKTKDLSDLQKVKDKLSKIGLIAKESYKDFAGK